MPAADAPPGLAMANQTHDPDLIQLLEWEADARGLSANELARRIGVDQSLWSRVRRGVDGERFGAEACARVVRAYPHLRSAAVRYLSGGRLPEPDALALLEEAIRAQRTDAPPDR